MEFLDYINEWTTAHPIATSIAKYVSWVVVILLAISFFRRFLHKRLPDNALKYKTQKGIEIIGYIIIILLTVSYFTGNIQDFGLAIGLFTAGITITLQELILSIAGSFYIFFVKIYKPGDRIEINGIKGDVIDIDSIHTTMMEIGEWVKSDNYSGRIVKLSNAFVFKVPIYNYSQDFPFVWDEFDLPISYGSDMELAKSIVIETASELLSEYVTNSMKKWEKVVNRYYIEDAQVNPTLSITMTDNWMEFNVRYIVDYKKRRGTKNNLQEQLSKKIMATNGKVKLASATFEIVDIPTLHVHSTKNEES